SPNISVRCDAEVVAAHGTHRLEALELRNRTDGAVTTVPASALFIFIGARPHTTWLEDALELDDRGFILTGQDGALPPGPGRRGVFAAGAIRHGSVKRVAAAVGEGSTAAMLVREHLTR